MCLCPCFHTEVKTVGGCQSEIPSFPDRDYPRAAGMDEFTVMGDHKAFSNCPACAGGLQFGHTAEQAVFLGKEFLRCAFFCHLAVG